MVPDVKVNCGESNSLYSQLIDSVTDYAIFALDEQGNVLSWNSGASRIQGYAAHEIVGQHISAFYPPDDVAAGKPQRELDVAARDGRIEEDGWRIRKDGSLFWANVVTSAMRDSQGAVVGFAKVTRDVSERRVADLALRHSEERFRLLVQSVQDYAILMLDASGHVTSWNEGAERIKGYTEKEILGRSFTTFYPQAAIESGFPQHELDVASRVGHFEDEGWRVRKDGSQFWANVVITALRNEAGELIGFAKVTRDLTMRRAAEEQARRLAAEQAAHAEAARRSAELQVALAASKAARDDAERAAAAAIAANRELDQFAYVASHDLKAPLRGISNLAQWIQEDAGDQLRGESAEHLRLLQGRVHRMEALIDGILAYSRAGRVFSQPERVDTGLLVQEAIELLAPPASVTIRVQEQMPTVEAERVPLQQVFLNLLSNAVKYTAATRPDAMIEVNWRDAGSAYEFMVRDNGPGIAPEFHDRIWGIFQTLAARDKVEGTGIGLSVVKKIIETRGGRVSVQSAAGSGATFRFHWPKTVRAENTE